MPIMEHFEDGEQLERCWWYSRCKVCNNRQETHQSIVFLVRVQCRRKESSRSLSHLLMSFLLYHAIDRLL